MRTTRCSKTRITGANQTAATKLTEDEKQRLHALAHGFNAHDYPDMSPEAVGQSILGYLADYYAPDWHPWEE